MTASSVTASASSATNSLSASSVTASASSATNSLSASSVTASASSATNSFSPSASSATNSISKSPVYICGNGIVEGHEQCDVLNNFHTWKSCCTPDCTWKSTGSACNKRQDTCFHLPRCTRDHVCRPGLPRSASSGCLMSDGKTHGHCVEGYCVAKNNSKQK